MNDISVKLLLKRKVIGKWIYIKKNETVKILSTCHDYTLRVSFPQAGDDDQINMSYYLITDVVNRHGGEKSICFF